MLYFNATILQEETVWECGRFDDVYKDDGMSINFHLHEPLKERDALNYLKKHLQEQERGWLIWSQNKFRINLDVFKSHCAEIIEDMLKEPEFPDDTDMVYLDFSIPTKLTLPIISGIIDVIPEFEETPTEKEYHTTVKFIITYNDIMEAKPKRIFLSHKTADKPLVREFRDTLKILGFEPWMDEDDLKAGDKLHRGILQGFKDSSAAIFFITPNFIEEKYLSTEVDYAITQSTEKGDYFKIITLIIAEDAATCKVPELLQQFVYKNPKGNLEALREIIKALPVKLPLPLLHV